MEAYTILLTIASIIVPVCATIIAAIYTVENRVKAEHKPYIVLNNITEIPKIDKNFYFIVMMREKVVKKFLTQKEIISEDNLNVKIGLRNIGYGVATNIRFYNLDDGTKITGNQEESSELIQKLFTTFDIAANEEKHVQASIERKIKDELFTEDVINTLCIYQDLNGNIYDFVFSIKIKNKGGYSYYAYQPSSHSYSRLIQEYSKEKKKILNDYMN